MEKEDLENIEKIQEKRELSKEAKDIIIGRAVANGAIGIAICILIFTFKLAANLLVKETAILVYNVYSIEILVLSLVLLEIAYKKDSGKWATSGMEMLVLAVFMLFSPYIFLRFNSKIMYPIILIIALYYIGKIIAIYITERQKYIDGISDIQDIIKRESQDDKAQEEKAKILEEKKQQKLEAEKKKTLKEKVVEQPKLQTKITKQKDNETKNADKKIKETATQKRKTTKKENIEPKKETTTRRKTATKVKTEETKVAPKKTTRKTTAKAEKEEKPKTTKSKTTSKPKTTTKQNSTVEKKTLENVVEKPAPKKRGRPRKNPETKKES